MKIDCRIYIRDDEGNKVLGRGPYELLKRTETSGSLNAAAKEMGMAYSKAYRIIRDAAMALRIEHVGTHTMRKTFGYHYYQKTHDVATLMQIFNHSAPSITLRYIGIEREQIEDSLADFNLL